MEQKRRGKRTNPEYRTGTGMRNELRQYHLQQLLGYVARAPVEISHGKTSFPDRVELRALGIPIPVLCSVFVL